MSFRWKTIFGIAAIELFFLSFLVWQAARYMQDLGETDVEKRAVDTVSLASTVLLDSLISFDLAAIQEHIHDLGALDGVQYVILEGHGRELASTGRYPDPEVIADSTVTDVTDGVYDVEHRLEVAGQSLGLLKIGFSIEELESVTATAKARLYLIAIFELILVALCSWLLGKYLTNRILLLRNASEKLQAGHSVEPISTVGKDEISTTINAFNAMSASLLEREQRLRCVNEELQLTNSKLSERENEIWSLFNAAPDGIAVLDTDGKISFANRELVNLLETAATPVTGRSLTDFLSVAGGEPFPDSLVGDTTKPHRQKSNVVNYSGKTLCVEINTSVFRASDSNRTIVIIRDKTHERELEQAVKLQEQLKTNLVDSSLDAVVTVNGAGKIIDFSQSAETLFGWHKAEIMGQAMAEYLIPPDLKAAHEKGMAHFLKTGEGPLIGKRVETKACHKVGKTFPVELSLTATWLDGEVYVTATIRDITERKQREEELVKAKAEAEEASQAKSRFLSYMSHEIRSPMNAVLGSLALIQERGNLQDSEQFYLDLARRSGDSLLRVVNEVLDFSKIEAGHVQYKLGPCSLADVIDSVQASILAKGVRENVKLSAKISESVPASIMTDGEHLRQILTILLDNAYKFTEKGEITISAREISSVTDDPARYLQISVRDTGPGVPAEFVDSIFSEFEQTDAIRDSGYGGTGLGLAIAQRLVTGMGGRIWVESELGTGSTFVIEVPFDTSDQLPLNEKAEPTNANSTDTESPARRAAAIHRILLVDDVEANLIIGSELLKNRGYAVDLARNGAEAVEMASLTEYSVILMDMRMPILNGLEATHKIRDSGGNNTATPIIALSANAEKSEIKRCLAGGMNGFVSKPFDIERLNQTIKNCLAESSKGETKMNREGEIGREPEVLCEEVLAQLTKDTSVESLPMMISVFINEIRKRTEGIDSAARSRNELEIREQAHALKSCSGTFGGLRLQAAAEQLEDLASKSNACANPELISQVLRVAEETHVAYSKFRESLQASSGSPNPSVH